MEVTVEGSNIPLKRGVDFELVYQLTPMEEIASADLFCGVQLLSSHVTGKLTFGGNTVGGDFVDPIQEILDMLVKHLNNPLVGKWEDVDGVPALMPKMATYRDWSDLLNTHYLSQAIDELGNSVEEGGDNEEKAIQLLRANVAALNTAIDAFNYPAHIAAKNPHNATAAQINAHPKNLAVADVVMGYSKDFFALCDYVRDRGLTEAQLQEYLSEYVVGDIEGTFSFEDGVATIESQDGTAKLDMNNGRVTISSQGSIFMQADSDIISSSEVYKLISGGNELKIVSSGAGMADNRIFLNGHEILNNRSIKAYQGDAGGGVSTVVITQSSTINLSGDGTADNPITGTLIIPTATPSVSGKARIKHSSGTETSGYVAHPKTAKAVSDQLQNLVSDDLRLNDKPLKGSGISIGKADAKLGNVDNTADLNKPLSDDLAAAVALLTGSNHTHNWSDLGIGHAGRNDYGIAYIANDIDNIPDNQGISPNVITQVKALLDAMVPRYSDTLVATDVEFASVEESEFSISGFTLTPLAPVNYTLSKNGAFVESTFTGAVDLATIPNTEWYTTDNDCETRWAKAVEYTNAPNWGKPPAAKYISVTPDYGKAGGVLAFKKRLKFKSTDFIIKIAADDSFIVYVDGVESMSGSGSTVVTLDAAVTPGRHAIAIEVRDGGGKGYLSFEIYDGTELIDVSDESWPCAELPLNADPTNNRFYIYGDTLTGGIVATVSAKPIGAVSSRYLFIGNVLSNYTQVKPNNGSNVKFETTIDYGSFNELTEHYTEADAHGGDGETDIVGLENVVGADICNGSTVVDIPYLLRRPRDYGSEVEAIYQSGVITKHTSPSISDRDMYHFIDGHCPAQYHCVKNKLAGDEYTVEGILHVRNDERPAQCPRWLFVSDGKSSDEVLVIDPNDLSAMPSFTIESMAKLVPSKSVKTIIADAAVEKVTTTFSGDEYDVYAPFPSNTNEDPYMFSMCRYRYIPRTNQLTILLAFEGKWECVDVTFDRNMASFFNKKAVGVRSPVDCVFGGVVDNFDLPDATIRRVTSYRALFESYLSGTDISKYAEVRNGITVKKDDYARLEKMLNVFTPATELVYHGSRTHEYYATHGQPLPALFCGMSWYSHPERPAVSLSKYHHGRILNAERDHIIPGGAIWTPATDEVASFTTTMDLAATSTFVVRRGDRYEGDGKSTGNLHVYVNKAKLYTFPPADEHTFTIDSGSNTLIELRLEASANVPNGLNITKDGVVISNYNWHYHMLTAPAEIVEYTMPWHTCQAAWERVVRIIETE
tara:strand:+ start:8410 stop:12240 length:3831 start_codon:yes stop_codon:yes gene_type:complete